MPIRRYYLGCPGWGVKTWVGRLFPQGTKPTEFLTRYAEVFNTVEGNTTFYALPTADTVLRWRDQVPDHFRFCFKFPRTITHDKLLLDAQREVDEFFARISPLRTKLGTLFLQLPPRFGPELLPRLDHFLARLPRDFHYGVEPRHEALFDGSAADAAAIALLRARRVDLVIMDARGLHASHSLEHADVRARKPALPVHMRATSTRPLVRLVPHEDFTQSRAFVDAWAQQLATWLAEGREPYLFMHAPDDTFAAENAYAFHERLRALADVGDLPSWPSAPRQLALL
ncbi:MAG: DUF72 domain-containing protein [Kofleriaceae bacterium]|nr:DUF72 domain-containing protein [Kofleriaceae bacterium]